MEHKHLLSALGVGIGVGVGLGIASGQSLSRWTGSDAYSQSITADKLEQEMMRLVVDGKDTGVTFDDFPYFLSEQTRVLLTSAAFVQLKQAELSKHTRYLSPASRTILLSGSAELYQQTLAKALAHCFDSKFLLLDVTDFCLKIQSKYGSNNKGTAIKRSLSVETLERFSGLVGSFPVLAVRDKDKGGLRRQRSGADIVGLQNSSSCTGHRRNFSASDNIDNLSSLQSYSNPVYPRSTRSWPFDEKALMQAFYGVIISVSKSSPMVVYLRDVETFLSRSQRVYVMFQKILKKISGPVLILGSQSLQSINESLEMNERLSAIFPYNLEIKPPKDEAHLVSWKSQLEEDIKTVQFQDNQNHIKEVLASSDLDCDELDSICVDDSLVLSNHIEEIMVSAISYHLTNNKDPIYRNGKLLISSKSLSHGLSIFQDIRSKGNLSLKLDKTHVPDQSKVEGESAILKPGKKSDVSSVNNNQGKDLTFIPKADCEPSLPPAKILEAAPDNEFEKRIRPEVILSKDICVTFSDIGAMDEIKESLQELVMLPLRRPDLFIGGLLKPCRGILLFGPPGTGKTMMAKAIAKEAGASFINVSMSTIASKWFGEDEKNVRALFTLAAKVSPTIIFVDEVDSMLGQRNRAGEHEAMRKIKNEFMIHWDGLLTRPGEQILVLAATNRPFDLDEAIIRRFERRIMIGLPSTENRKMIFKTLLSKAQISDSVEFGELAAITEGYSGSDIKNLCTTAAYRPVRELIQQERLKDLEKKRIAAEIQGVENLHERKVVIKLRPLNMGDFRQAKSEVAASFSAESSSMGELKQWNELYGEGGSRKKQQLTYFL